MDSLQEWLQDVVAGHITLQRAEEVLNMRSSLVELLLLYKDLHAASVSSEPADTAEVAVQALQDMVSQYANRASAAYAFLSFCRKCELRGAAELDAKGQDLLKHDRAKPVRRLAELGKGRWWFCKHAAIQSLPDCTMFVRYVRDWVATRHASWSGERQRDPEEDKELENEAADTMQEADEQILELEIELGEYRACRGIVLHLDGLLKEFKSICKSIAETKPERIVLTRLRAVLPLGEAIEVREWLQKAAEVSGQPFSEDLLHSVEKCFQLGSAKADLRALCAASQIFGACEQSWELMAGMLVDMETAIEESRPPELDSILQSGFSPSPIHYGGVHSKTVSAVAEQVQLAEDHILLKLREGGTDDIVRALSDAKELDGFLRPLLKEDLMPLQDAVEEHSDELIRADTIFALLDMQRFFRLLVKRTARIQSNFVWAIKDTHRELKGDVDDIGDKLRVCSQHCHGLSNLYKNLSSREEMAGEKIKHASREGVYRLHCRASGVEIALTYVTFLDGRHQQADNIPNKSLPPQNPH
ncbi:RNF213 [Symbiodinium sp. CCMP2592]|nr:RNF213 [Symbiodinium sp. CCMP2592]